MEGRRWRGGGGGGSCDPPFLGGSLYFSIKNHGNGVKTMLLYFKFTSMTTSLFQSSTYAPGMELAFCGRFPKEYSANQV